MNIVYQFLKVFLLFALCTAQLPADAQKEQVEEYQQKLAVAKDQLQRINLANKVSYEMRVMNPDSALLIAHHNFALAKKENYEYGAGVANLCISLGNSAKGNYELQLDYAKRALSIGESIKSDSLIAASHLGMGSAYYNKSNYDLSIEKALLAIQIYTKLNNADGVTKARVLMAQVYQLKDDLPAAEKILLDVYKDPKTDLKVQLNVMHTLANIYGMQGSYKAALEMDEKGLLICREKNLLYLQSQFFDNMANCFMFSNDFRKAEDYFYKCLAIDSSLGNRKQMADTYLNLGQLAAMEKNYSGAIPFLLHSIKLSEATGYRQGTYGAYLLLSKVYAKNNQKDSALAAVNKGYLIKDSVINESGEKRIAELQTLFDTEKKEQELNLQKIEINKKNYFLAALTVAIVLISLLGILYFRKRSLQNKIELQNEVLKQQDLATKAIIEAEENERKRIAAELHDGVGQMMSAAKMNLSVFEHELSFNSPAQKAGFENVIGLVDESCKEIRNVSHQMMPNALLKSGLASAIKEFLSKIDDRIIKVSLHTEGLQERLEGNVETVLYRVVQECVNNVLKHSEANHLDISIIKDHEGISATIEDNGKGFDISAAEQSSGIGLKNTMSRIQYLRGSIDFHSKKGSGTVVAIHIPAE